MSNSVRPHRWQPTRLRRPWDSLGKNTGVGYHVLLQCRKVKSESEVAQSCPTLRDSMGCSLPGSSVHGIFQARVLEWGATAFSAGMVLVAFFFLSICISEKWSHLGWDFDSPDCPLLSHCIIHCHCQMNVKPEQRHKTQFAY